jgi:2,4-dienoyl-CoA reductase (NADPH2)
MFEDKPVSCLVNPRAGRELELNITPTDKAKKVMVIGAGAAGMQAALIAKQRGHDVTLYEKANRLGGQLNQCWRSYGKGEWQNLLFYFEREINKHRVPVNLNTPVDAAMIAGLKPDVVILAAGAAPRRPDIPGANLPHVFLAEDFLEERVEVGKKVVVIGGGPVGVEVANDLARIGTIDAATIQFLYNYDAESPESIKDLMTRGTKQVTIVERGSILGEGLGLSSRWVLLLELKRRNVRSLTKATAVEITPDSIIIQQNQQIKAISADTVIVATGYSSNSQLSTALGSFDGEVHIIGDAVRSRKAVEAIYEGYLIGAGI